MKHVKQNATRSRRARTAYRLASRVRSGLVLAGALGVFSAGVAVFHERTPQMSNRRGVAAAHEPPIRCGPCLPEAKPASGKRDVTRINVSTYSTANAVGPSQNDLGPGWTFSFESNDTWCFFEARSAGIPIDGRQRDSTWTETYWESPVSVYDFLTGAPYGVNDYVLANPDQPFRLDNYIEERLMALGDGLVSEITNYGASSPRRRHWITYAAARRPNCGRNPDTASLDNIIDPAAAGETTTETRRMFVFPCRCKRRPPRQRSKAIRLARRSCPMR